MRIRNRLAISTVGVVVLVAIFFVAVLGFDINEKINRNVEQANSATLRYAFAAIDTRVADIESKISGISEDPAVIEAARGPGNGSAALEKKFSEIMARSPELDGLALHSADCVAIAADSRNLAVIGRNFSGRDFCGGMKETQAAYVSGSFINAVNGKPTIAIAVPVKGSGGAYLGYVVGVLNTEALQTQLIKLQQGEYLILLDRYGKKFLDTGMRMDEITLSDQDNETETIFKEITDGRSTGMLQHYDNIISFRDFGYLTIATGQPKATAMQLENELIGSMMFAIMVASGLMLLLVWSLSKSITEPIEKLTRNVDEITRGNLDMQLERSEIYEVQQLTDALNRILASLKLAVLRAGMKKSDMGLGEAIAARKEAENKYELLFNSIGQIVTVNRIMPDGPGNFTEVNDYACRVFGYTREELLSMGPQDLDESLKQKKNIAETVKLLLSGKPVTYVHENRTKDGRRIMVKLTLRSTEVGDEKLIISVGQEVTEELKAKGPPDGAVGKKGANKRKKKP